MYSNPRVNFFVLAGVLWLAFGKFPRRVEEYIKKAFKSIRSH